MTARLVRSDETKPEHSVFGGLGSPWGGPDSMTWDEYRNFGHIEPAQCDAIRECVERTQLVGAYAEDICNDYCFEFDDGNRVGFSWRAWGDFMQAIVGKREGYMQYYMCWGDLQPFMMPELLNET